MIENGCEVIVDKKINLIFKNKFKLAKELIGKLNTSTQNYQLKAVKNVEDAITHIIKYGTMHTDSIISTNEKNTTKFFKWS